MKLVIPFEVRVAMINAARDAAPLEACGLLGGSSHRVSAFYALTNTDASAEHYNMQPEEQFAAARDMRVKGLSLQAIWHSHPSTPARMSEEDLRMSYTPDVVYVIVSLAMPDAPDVRGFSVDNGISVEVELVTVETGDTTMGEERT